VPKLCPCSILVVMNRTTSADAQTHPVSRAFGQFRQAISGSEYSEEGVLPMLISVCDQINNLSEPRMSISKHQNNNFRSYDYDFES
jgi:hypothetical protein